MSEMMNRLRRWAYPLLCAGVSAAALVGGIWFGAARPVPQPPVSPLQGRVLDGVVQVKIDGRWQDAARAEDLLEEDVFASYAPVYEEEEQEPALREAAVPVEKPAPKKPVPQPQKPDAPQQEPSAPAGPDSGYDSSDDDDDDSGSSGGGSDSGSGGGSDSGDSDSGSGDSGDSGGDSGGGDSGDSGEDSGPSSGDGEDIPVVGD